MLFLHFEKKIFLGNGLTIIPMIFFTTVLSRIKKKINIHTISLLFLSVQMRGLMYGD